MVRHIIELFQLDLCKLPEKEEKEEEKAKEEGKKGFDMQSYV